VGRRFPITPALATGPPSHHRDTFDLDQEVRVEQALDHDQSVGWNPSNRSYVRRPNSAGTDNMDLVASCQARGVTVTHTPGVNSHALAEHTLALMLAVTRRIPAMGRDVRAGQWPRGLLTQLEGAPSAPDRPRRCACGSSGLRCAGLGA
jgi:hypothetical protein